MMTVISGAQTGVDRAALDVAVGVGLSYRGWCPKDGWAEDCPDPPGVRARYSRLQETPEAASAQRTAWNVRDSDALMVLVDGCGLAVSKGAALARETAQALGKPFTVVNVDSPDALNQVGDFLAAYKAQAVCIAGPRESEAPGIYGKAKGVLLQALVLGKS